MAERFEGPPGARCAEDASPIVYHNLAVIADAQAVHGCSKLGLRGEHVGQGGCGVSHLVYVKVLRSWDPGSAELGCSVPACRCRGVAAERALTCSVSVHVHRHEQVPMHVLLCGLLLGGQRQAGAPGQPCRLVRLLFKPCLYAD